MFYGFGNLKSLARTPSRLLPFLTRSSSGSPRYSALPDGGSTSILENIVIVTNMICYFLNLLVNQSSFFREPL
jgi:hypothetical protein